ncbi:type IV-A pilus assembly ATPase PilB [Candidatus Vondammii sp. HM_W22]|uniref:type IV-A pilus assembly ATPase PilB n=1 Tax=Candidatus Vondammii sp. HM_W22 TaxID=2687299 RepID=UPI001F143513|nr:type IV-A pilus assembly ATPase PilB [Candidatus Vondammii sp. HM_W22]
MATTKPEVSVNGLARWLVHDSLLSEESAQQAFQEALKQRKPFVTHLVEKKMLKSREIAEYASQKYGIPLFDLDALDMETTPSGLVEEKLVRTHHLLPLIKRGNRLFLGVSDPTNLQSLDEIKFHTGLSTEVILVEEDKLTKIIEIALQASETSISDMLAGDDLDYLNITVEENEGVQDGDLDVDYAPVVRFVNKILLDGISTGASDIHFEHYEKTFRVRYRRDGILHEVASPPVSIASRLTARIKVMSKLNVSERRVPQDGRIKMVLSRNRSIDFRVNTCPTLYGEKIVLRILDSTSTQLGIEALGLEPQQMNAFNAAINKPYGMILVTGPTGSGKTVSLYTALNILNKPEINISTVEDPVEIQVQGINQVNTNTKTGLTFASALRAFLRQDPDIIMVGEIRDLETAEIAVKAAQTGHLVLSTLHTNDAPQTLTRLANMGIPAFSIASSVLLIMAQRLTRRLCQHCKEAEALPKEALLKEGFKESELKDLTTYRAVGCDLCAQGYKGRLGIFQVMPISSNMEKLIMEGGNSMQLEALGKSEGTLDLRTSGLNKVRAGLTSLEEINRVTKD